MSEAVVRFKLHNVKGDGNCFYRAVARALMEWSSSGKGRVAKFVPDAAAEDDVVATLRGQIANMVLTHGGKWKTLLDRYADAGCIEAYRANNDYCQIKSTSLEPCVRQKADTSEATLKQCFAHNVRTTKGWAFQLDIDFMSLWLRNHGIELLVLSNKATIKYDIQSWVKAQAAERKQRKRSRTHFVLIVYNSSNHYNYVTTTYLPEARGALVTESVVPFDTLDLLTIVNNNVQVAGGISSVAPHLSPRAAALNAARKKRALTKLSAHLPRLATTCTRPGA